MKNFFDSCVTCPAALVCRSTGIHYTALCTKCEHPWIMMLRDSKSNEVHLVRFPKGHSCDEKEYRWADNMKAYCPECAGPGRGKLVTWKELCGKEVFYVNSAETPPRFSKI